MIKLSRLTTDSIQGILKDALDFAEGKVMKAKSDIFVANLFFEDSTRTKVSFEIAEKRLNARNVSFSCGGRRMSYNVPSKIAKEKALYKKI